LTKTRSRLDESNEARISEIDAKIAA